MSSHVSNVFTRVQCLHTCQVSSHVSPLQELGEQWAREGRQRRLRGGATVAEYREVNRAESAALAQAFVSEKFMR